MLRQPVTVEYSQTRSQLIIYLYHLNCGINDFLIDTDQTIIVLK